jgi:hypothetical protein
MLNSLKGVDRSNNRPYYYKWYELEPPCDSGTVGDGLTCDEYPFASTAQGGKTNYDEAHAVSLRLVPDSEQLGFFTDERTGRSIKSTGSQFYKMGQFYTDARVDPNDPKKSWFVVETTNQSYSHFWSLGLDGYRRREFTGDAESF